MSNQHYCLRWNNYQTNMTSVFHQLLENEAFVDVTLACNDLSLKAHKVVLSACSSYFRKLLLENPCKHPTIIMPPDVRYDDLRFIVEFVYRGEIDVSQAELQSLLRTADQLKIKGLCELPEEEEEEEEKELPKARRLEGHASLANNRKRKKPTTTDEEEDKASPSSDEDNDKPVCLNSNEEDKDRERRKVTPPSPTPVQNKPLNMSSNALLAGQMLFSQFGVDNDDFPPEPPAPSATPVGHVDMQDQHSPSRTLLTNSSIHRTDLSDAHVKYCDIKKEADVEFETLRSFDQDSLLDIDGAASRMSSAADHSLDGSHADDTDRMHRTAMMIAPELLGMMPGGSHRMDSMEHSLKTNGHGDHLSSSRHGGGPKTWTQDDMELALDALRNHNMSLTKASATYGIPSTTLWQRAHRLGIDTPKKEGPTKSWTEENLNSALEALRTGTISANKASKAYGIPSSTLYKIARREGIRLAAPFNAAPTTWTPEDLEKALESIRSGQTSVQRASTEYGIPTGTLYGRCKREGIELSRSNPTPWSEDAMGEALEAVRLGHMSINQAAIHYNLPYSSLYGRFKRGVKYDPDPIDPNADSQSQMDGNGQSLLMNYENAHQLHYQNQPTS